MTIDDIFQNAVESWKNNKGVGTMLCPAPLNDKIPILLILERIYNKSPTTTTTIVVNRFNDRLDLIEFLTNQESEENNKEFKSLIDKKLLKIITYSFFIDTVGNLPKRIPTLGIIYNPNCFDKYLEGWISSCRFKLVVLNKVLDEQSERISLNNTVPTLNEFKQAEIDELRTTRPVEELFVPVSIIETSEEFKLLEYYNNEITTTLNIFGNFDNIDKARKGDSQLNISAADYCNRIAHDNGWNEHLDMSIEYNRLVDDMYNPNILNEKANKIFEFIRLRNTILSDYEGKLKEIYNICKENEEKKILIINKKGEFATKVTEYINDMFGFEICGSYHNKLKNIISKNPDGSIVYVKTGVNKGKPKEIGYQAQMTLNQDKFNKNILKILSTANSPDKKLNIDVDIVIITSPMCEDIESYLYRLSKINYTKDVIKLYTIFCKNTTEEKQLSRKNVSKNHRIVNKNEISDFSDKNFSFTIAS